LQRFASYRGSRRFASIIASEAKQFSTAATDRLWDALV
jgi:hypothetical protein